jgi:hypothetical protein
VKEVEITDLTTAIDNLRELGVRIYPNPVRDGMLRVEGLDHRTVGVEVFDVRGAVVARHAPGGQSSWQVRLPQGTGTYMVVIRTAQRAYVERIVAF